MFNIFRKKTQVESLIATEGMEQATDRFADLIAQKLTSREIAYQFIREELDAARRGNAAARLFAENSGFHSAEYLGALNDSVPEVDGAEGPQQQLLALSLQLSNQQLMAEFRCKIDDKIMRNFNFGKYAHKEERIDNLFKSLKNILVDDKDVIPTLSPGVPVPVNARVKHIHNRERNIASARELISLLSQMTGADTEALIGRALSTHQLENKYSHSIPDKKKRETGGAKLTAVIQPHALPPEVNASKRLVELVERKARTPLGAFEDLNRDLAVFIEKNFETGEPTVKMAYAYARRTAMAGLFFQGIVGENVVKHVQDIFIAFQHQTGQTIAFQQQAAIQADEILRCYVPRVTPEHGRVLVNYAREGITAMELAGADGLDFEIDELEEDPVSISTCIDLVDRVFEVSNALGMALRPTVDPKSQKRLIDVVEKTNNAKLGPFASMCEDVRSSAQSYRGDNILFYSAGYALILGSCGTYVAGGVHPKLVLDTLTAARTLMAGSGSDPEVTRICKEQAVALARTYVHKLTLEAAEVITEMGCKLDVFTKDGETRLSPEDVVLRAKHIARNNPSFGSQA